jgi:ribose 5-phosphate isomerase B
MQGASGAGKRSPRRFLRFHVGVACAGQRGTEVRMIVGVACDHAGLRIKSEATAALKEMGHTVEDLGTDSDVSVDYPDFAELVARGVATGKFERGVLVCGTGIGMSIAANKHAGIRAAVCTTEFEARLGRAHNNANVLCLGERVVGLGLAHDIVRAFFTTSFEGGRHERRVEKLNALDNREVTDG